MSKETKQLLFLPSELDGCTGANLTYEEFSNLFYNYLNEDFVYFLSKKVLLTLILTTAFVIFNGHRNGETVAQVKEFINTKLIGYVN